MLKHFNALLPKNKMGWVGDDEVRSLFKMDNCERQTCKCPAQRNNTQKQIDKIQKASAKMRIAAF